MEDSDKKKHLCTICGKLFTSRKILMSHIRAHVKGPFPCPHCDKKFAHATGLSRHREIHRREKRFVCSQCNKVFTSRTYLELHLKTHSTDRNFVCNICGKAYKGERSLNRHTALHYKAQFTCDLCQQPFKSQMLLNAHKKCHGPYSCVSCNGAINVSKEALMKHEKKHHSTGPDETKSHNSVVKQQTKAKKQTGVEVDCSFCNKMCRSAGALQLHMKEHFNTTVCVRCHRSFSRMSDLRRHVRTHEGEVETMCACCGATMPDQEQLHAHMAAIHGVREIYTCAQCPIKCFTRMSYNMHVETKHAERSLRYACAVCNKRFTHKWYALKHLRTHTGEKPFSCRICGKGFAWRTSLLVHLRVHSDDKRFECQECGKRFLLKAQLQLHSNVHSGRKPYKCKNCPRSFNFPSGLISHERQHYKVKPYQCIICQARFANYGSIAYHLKKKHGKEINKRLYKLDPRDPNAEAHDIVELEETDVETAPDFNQLMTRTKKSSTTCSLTVSQNQQVMSKTGDMVLMPEALANMTGHRKSSILANMADGIDVETQEMVLEQQSQDAQYVTVYMEDSTGDNQIVEVPAEAYAEMQRTEAGSMQVATDQDHFTLSSDNASAGVEGMGEIILELMPGGDGTHQVVQQLVNDSADPTALGTSDQYQVIAQYPANDMQDGSCIELDGHNVCFTVQADGQYEITVPHGHEHQAGMDTEVYYETTLPQDTDELHNSVLPTDTDELHNTAEILHDTVEVLQDTAEVLNNLKQEPQIVDVVPEDVGVSHSMVSLEQAMNQIIEEETADVNKMADINQQTAFATEAQEIIGKSLQENSEHQVENTDPLLKGGDYVEDAKGMEASHKNEQATLMNAENETFEVTDPKELGEINQISNVALIETARKNRTCGENMVWNGERHFCDKCNASYKNEKALRKHMKVHDMKASDLTCKWCERVFSRKDALARHVERHSKKKEYVCKVCSEKFGYQCLLYDHIERVHHTPKWPQRSCNASAKTTAWNSELGNTASNLSCSWCGKAMSSPTALAKHRERHSAAETYECEYCHVPFRYRCVLYNHMEEKHDRQMWHSKSEKRAAVLQCQYCEKVFKHKASLMMHVKKVSSSRNLLCLICREGFAAECILSKHIENQHNMRFVEYLRIAKYNHQEETKPKAKAIKKEDDERDEMMMDECIEPVFVHNDNTGKDFYRAKKMGGNVVMIAEAIGSDIVYKEVSNSGEIVDALEENTGAQKTDENTKLDDEVENIESEISEDEEELENGAMFGVDEINEDPLRCDNCKEYFFHERELQLHAISCISEPLECEFCPSVFLLQKELTKHTCDLGPNPVTCEICQRQFFNSYHLYNHMEKRHKSERAECLTCNNGFKFLQEYYLHLDEFHTELELICKKCDLDFKTRSELNRHMSTEHANETKNQCLNCMEVFASAGGLRRHRKTCEFEGGGKTNEAKTVQCDECKKHVPHKNLAQHFVLHNQGVQAVEHLGGSVESRRQVSCPICSKTVAKGYLQHHMKSHAGKCDADEFKMYKGKIVGRLSECKKCLTLVSEFYMERHLKLYCKGKKPEKVEVVEGKAKCSGCGVLVNWQYLPKHKAKFCKKSEEEEIVDEQIGLLNGEMETETVVKSEFKVKSKSRRNKKGNQNQRGAESEINVVSVRDYEESESRENEEREIPEIAESESEEIVESEESETREIDESESKEIDESKTREVVESESKEIEESESRDIDETESRNIGEKEIGDMYESESRENEDSETIQIESLEIKQTKDKTENLGTVRSRKKKNKTSENDLTEMKKNESKVIRHIKKAVSHVESSKESQIEPRRSKRQQKNLEDGEIDPKVLEEKTAWMKVEALKNAFILEEGEYENVEEVTLDELQTAIEGDNGIGLEMAYEVEFEDIDDLKENDAVEIVEYDTDLARLVQRAESMEEECEEPEEEVVVKQEGKKGSKVRCPKCGAMHLRTYIRRHMQTHEHQAKRERLRASNRYACTICGMRMKYARDLSQHVKRHQGAVHRPHKCTYCEKRFEKPSGLKAHMNSHTGERQYTCKLCPKTFTVESNLNRHLRTIHKKV